MHQSLDIAAAFNILQARLPVPLLKLLSFDHISHCLSLTKGAIHREHTTQPLDMLLCSIFLSSTQGKEGKGNVGEGI